MIVVLVLIFLGKEFEASLGPSVLIDRYDQVDTFLLIYEPHVVGLKWEGILGVKVVNFDDLRSDDSVDKTLAAKAATIEVLFFLLHDEQEFKVFDLIVFSFFCSIAVFGGFLWLILAIGSNVGLNESVIKVVIHRTGSILRAILSLCLLSLIEVGCLLFDILEFRELNLEGQRGKIWVRW